MAVSNRPPQPQVVRIEEGLFSITGPTVIPLDNGVYSIGVITDD